MSESTPKPKQPNIVVIWGDDIGMSESVVLLAGIDGLPHAQHRSHRQRGHAVHRLLWRAELHRGPLLLHHRAERVPHRAVEGRLAGRRDRAAREDPTIAALLKPLGYATGQFGKNHLGDRNEFLPTVHGFDEFYGNLYHLNAEEEPELPDYPKESEFPNFRKRFGPRGVMDCKATHVDDATVDPRYGRVGKQVIKDTGPLTKKRMETIDDDIAARSVDFIQRMHQAGKPFFIWVNFTHMHLRTHTKPESVGQSGRWQSPYHDVMIDHDRNVGTVLAKLDELGLADNTIVMYGTDNGPHANSWPDGATTPFRSEKNTNWEGAFRVPWLVRWPGKIKPGSVSNEIVSHHDWLPTLAGGGRDAGCHGSAEGRLHDRRSHLQGAYRRLQLPAVPDRAGEPWPAPGFFYFSDDGDLSGAAL